MSEYDPNRERLLGEIKSLRQEVAALQIEKAAFEAQKRLIANLVAMTRVPVEEEERQAPSRSKNLIDNLMAIVRASSTEDALNNSLQNVLDASIELTDAEKGSLFLLDSHHNVTHSILTRSELPLPDRQSLIGKILDRGLAGWVCKHRQVGLVTDTETDDRWLTLPDQPYIARSALVIPILSGREELLSIVTLLHSRPGHFSREVADLMQATADQIALVLEMVALKAAFKNERSAAEIQKKLLEHLVETEGSPSESEVLKGTLQKILDLSTELTKAEKGSLFLLDPSGKILDAILSRAEVTPKQRAALIGSVLDKGLAGWVSENRRCGLIADTETDDRWLTLPDQPYTVRSALAAPILRGERLNGILTLLHSQPGHFSPEIAEQIKVTADQIALVLENARLYSKLDRYSKALDAELEKGRQIQIDFLPYEICQPPGWEIGACFYPARQVAGDFYDVFSLDNHVGLVIADVCDKGVGAALFMALFRSLIRIFSRPIQPRGPASTILEETKPFPGGWLGDSAVTNLAHVNALNAVPLTNDYVSQNHPNLSMFATLFFGVLDPSTGLLTYINGGHEPLFVLGKSGLKATLTPTGPAVGMMPNMKFKIQQIRLEPGDLLFGYTDGVTEGKNPDGELFTTERLLDLLLARPVASATDLLDRVQTGLFRYIDEASQFDDITMLAVRRYPESAV